MIKTYNHIRRHVGDDLGQLVVDYITPRTRYVDDIINAGCCEMLSMLGEEDCYWACRVFIGRGELELASVVRTLNSSRALCPDEVALMSKYGYEDALLDAIHTLDIKKAKNAIYGGANGFINSIEILNQQIICESEESAHSYLSAFLRWCTDEPDVEFVRYVCSPLFVSP